jgi:hypothetical protein
MESSPFSKACSRGRRARSGPLTANFTGSDAGWEFRSAGGENAGENWTRQSLGKAAHR